MSDDIPGYGIDEAEIKATVARMIGELVADLDASEPDHLVRYIRLTAEQVTYRAIAAAYVSAVKELRGAELRAMADDGATLTQIAEAAGLGTKQRVGALIAYRAPE